MENKTWERKVNILKLRISSLIDEHAEIVIAAQDLHDQLQEAKTKIRQLEEELESKNVQKKEPGITIINSD